MVTFIYSFSYIHSDEQQNNIFKWCSHGNSTWKYGYSENGVRIMKLYEYKTKYIAELMPFAESDNQRERELTQTLIIKLHALRMMTLPDYLFTLSRIITGENVSNSFKELCKNMINDSKQLSNE